jgi:hypothetical protein
VGLFVRNEGLRFILDSTGFDESSSFANYLRSLLVIAQGDEGAMPQVPGNETVMLVRPAKRTKRNARNGKLRALE